MNYTNSDPKFIAILAKSWLSATGGGQKGVPQTTFSSLKLKKKLKK